jgi:hypothetical protein
MIWLLSHPLPSLSRLVRKLDRRHAERPAKKEGKLVNRRGGGGGRGARKPGSR